MTERVNLFKKKRINLTTLFYYINNYQLTVGILYEYRGRPRDNLEGLYNFLLICFMTTRDTNFYFISHKFIFKALSIIEVDYLLKSSQLASVFGESR